MPQLDGDRGGESVSPTLVENSLQTNRFPKGKIRKSQQLSVVTGLFALAGDGVRKRIDEMRKTLVLRHIATISITYGAFKVVFSAGKFVSMHENSPKICQLTNCKKKPITASIHQRQCPRLRRRGGHRP